MESTRRNIHIEGRSYFYPKKNSISVCDNNSDTHTRDGLPGKNFLYIADSSAFVCTGLRPFSIRLRG